MPYLGIKPAPTATDILDASVVNVDLASNSVTETKIADYSVTTNKIGNTAVTTTRLGTGAVTYAKLAIRWKDISNISPANTTIAVGDKCLVGTANGSVGVVLPINSLTMGDEVEFMDKDGQWGTNNLTVHSGSSTINIDYANNFTMNVSNTSVKMVYTGSNIWRTQVWN